MADANVRANPGIPLKPTTRDSMLCLLAACARNCDSFRASVAITECTKRNQIFTEAVDWPSATTLSKTSSSVGEERSWLRTVSPWRARPKSHLRQTLSTGLLTTIENHATNRHQSDDIANTRLGAFRDGGNVTFVPREPITARLVTTMSR
ncbi:MAG: hypothetical protein IID44_31605 [Planctomycetes bacterium]|nr:hypothetical protein [Planctomycetota bacterium]